MVKCPLVSSYYKSNKYEGMGL